MRSFTPSSSVGPIPEDDSGLFYAFEMLMIATVLSGILYGVLAMLYFNCISLLLKSKHLYSKRMRPFLIIYTTGMFLLSTGAIIQEIIILNLNFLELIGWESYQDMTFNRIPVTTPFIIWGADGLTTWRCLILYQGTSWIGNLTLNILLAVLSLASLVAGISYFLAQNVQNAVLTLVSTFLTPAVNIILASLLAARILYQQTRISKLLGPEMKRESPYTRIATMCIESSALIIVVGVAGIITTFEAYYWSAFPYFFMPHICAISPLLIVYRVAQGRSLETVTRHQMAYRRSVSPLNFAMRRPHLHVRESNSSTIAEG